MSTFSTLWPFEVKCGSDTSMLPIRCLCMCLWVLGLGQISRPGMLCWQGDTILVDLWSRVIQFVIWMQILFGWCSFDVDAADVDNFVDKVIRFIWPSFTLTSLEQCDPIYHWAVLAGQGDKILIWFDWIPKQRDIILAEPWGRGIWSWQWLAQFDWRQTDVGNFLKIFLEQSDKI